MYKTFEQFYPFYLSEHMDPVNRVLHFVGTTLVLSVLSFNLYTAAPASSYLVLPLLGYGFAWVGHFFFEQNKPATFKYPFYSFMGDFRMWFDIIRQEQPLMPSPKRTRGKKAAE